MLQSCWPAPRYLLGPSCFSPDNPFPHNCILCTFSTYVYLYLWILMDHNRLMPQVINLTLRVPRPTWPAPSMCSIPWETPWESMLDGSTFRLHLPQHRQPRSSTQTIPNLSLSSNPIPVFSSFQTKMKHHLLESVFKLSDNWVCAAYFTSQAIVDKSRHWTKPRPMDLPMLQNQTQEKPIQCPMHKVQRMAAPFPLLSTTGCATSIRATF